MSVKKPIGQTGKAQIVKQGHTTDGNFGSDPMARGKGQKPVRDLGVKRTGSR